MRSLGHPDATCNVHDLWDAQSVNQLAEPPMLFKGVDAGIDGEP